MSARKKSPGRGGKRIGSGRTPLAGKGAGKAPVVSVCLTAEQLETAMILGDGTVRVGVRDALDHSRTRALKKQAFALGKAHAQEAEDAMSRIIENASPPLGKVKGGL